VIDIASALDDDGLEIQFMNREGASGVKSWSDIKGKFDKRARGGTPTTKCLEAAVDGRSSDAKPLLIVLATDGSPDSNAKFTEWIHGRDGASVFVSVLVCTDNHSQVDFLNGIDEDDCTMDVLDDFRAEKKEVRCECLYLCVCVCVCVLKE
jgi:hypothetical protein